MINKNIHKERANPPLGDTIFLCADMVHKLWQGVSWTTWVETVPHTARSSVQAIGFLSLRHLGLSQFVLKQLVQKKTPASVRAFLVVALTVLIAGDEDDFMVVHQAVETAKKTHFLRAKAGFINACLRSFLRDKDEILSKAQSDAQAKWNFPLWWIEKLKGDYPQDWQEILLSAQEPAALILRVNLAKNTRQSYQSLLNSQGIEHSVIGEYGVLLHKHWPVHELPGFLDGLFSVQDSAAQMAAPLILSHASKDKKLSVLDACAAPGGKAAHILEYAHHKKIEIELTTLEMDEKRNLRIVENLQRLQLNKDTFVDIKVGDAKLASQLFSPERKFDCVLLDAPCSASGIVRRHPDIRWLRKEGDVLDLSQEQSGLLDALWSLVQCGGSLLFCTCSIFKEEGLGHVKPFLERHKNARLHGDVISLLPFPFRKVNTIDVDLAHDGFFYALFEKISA